MAHLTTINHDGTSYKIMKCSTIDDGHLMKAVKSGSSHEAVALLNAKENSFTPDGLNQALISACRRGHKLLVQTLVRVGANIEHPDENENTPLLICADHGFTDIVRFLVSRHANVNARNSTGNTALILSVRSAGSTDLTSFLLEQKDVDIHHENQDGHSALSKATQFMDMDTVRLLLEQSLTRRTNSRCRNVQDATVSHIINSSSPTIKAAANARLEDVFKIMMEYLITGASPLELAIKVHDTQLLNILLECQFSSRTEKQRYIDSAFVYVFLNSQHASVHRFSSTEREIIQMLLQCGADVNKSSAGTKLISLAVESGDSQLVELMCTHGAELNRDSYSGEQDPLCIAAKNGRLDLIELLLKYGADVNRYGFSESALDNALRNDHTECAKLLIEHGAKIDVACALSYAVVIQLPNYVRFLFYNYQREIVDYFSQQITFARQLLTSAVEKGNSDIIGQILDAGFDVNEVDSFGKTPLMSAKNRAVAEFLIQRGADVMQVIKCRECTEKLLSYMINDRTCMDDSTIELCRVLIANGASVNCCNREGKTPLMMAASRNDCVSMLQMLLDNGADANYKDKEGNTALLHAITKEHSKNVFYLIDSTRHKTTAINIRNIEGLTPLMVSVKKGNVNFIKKTNRRGRFCKYARLQKERSLAPSIDCLS